MTTTAGNIGNYSPPLELSKRHKLVMCPNCMGLVLDKCEACNKLKESLSDDKILADEFIKFAKSKNWMYTYEIKKNIVMIIDKNSIGKYKTERFVAKIKNGKIDVFSDDSLTKKLVNQFKKD